MVFPSSQSHFCSTILLSKPKSRNPFSRAQSRRKETMKAPRSARIARCAHPVPALRRCKAARTARPPRGQRSTATSSAGTARLPLVAPNSGPPRAVPSPTPGRGPPRPAGLTGDLGLGHAVEAEALGPIQLPDLGAAPRLAAAVTASRGGGDTQQPKSPREETHPSPLAPPPAVRRAKPRSGGGDPGAGRSGVRAAPAGRPAAGGRRALGRCPRRAGKLRAARSGRRGESEEGAAIQVCPGRAPSPPRFETPKRDRGEGFCS